MCLITTQQTPKILKRDKKVYKELDGDNSLYQNFIYIRGKLYKTEMQESDDWKAYDSKESNYLDKNYPGWRWNGNNSQLKCIGPGFHAFTNKKRSGDQAGFLSIAIIPKGSEYYIDGRGLIVSNQIIIH